MKVVKQLLLNNIIYFFFFDMINISKSIFKRVDSDVLKSA